MGEQTAIAWTDATWNPVTGCTKVSEGCRHCYAERISERFGRDFSQVVIHQDRIDAPLHWKKPRRIFVNSMSDLFHRDVPAADIVRIFEVMAACPQHEFQVLTKRPERIEGVLYGDEGGYYLGGGDWHPHIWVGFSAEDQATFETRWASIGKWAYAMNLFVSLEPLLGPIHLGDTIRRQSYGPQIRWVIVGGESGPGARPMDPDWVRSIRDQCVAASVPLFVKQDSGPRPGHQGRLPDDLWAMKAFPVRAHP